jgi:hypothetical protein
MFTGRALDMTTRRIILMPKLAPKPAPQMLPNKERPAHRIMRGPTGGLIGIDQEVVTLTWPLR